MPELQGFGDGGYQSEAELDTRALVQEQNRKKKKSGGFQSMGLSYNVFHGIMKCGYKIPTPIQRKVSSIKLFLFFSILNIFFYSVFH
jgi:ATP-dependent RNA helicase DDX54/DBP10